MPMQTVKKVEVEERLTYSIVYFYDEDPCRYALDWAFTPTDGKSKNDGRPAELKWFASVKEGEQWWPHAEKDEKIRLVLLEHFGLSKWADEFPAERIKLMSPRRLAEIRRWKESEYGLAKKEMKSDTVGFKINAEDYEG